MKHDADVDERLHGGLHYLCAGRGPALVAFHDLKRRQLDFFVAGKPALAAGALTAPPDDVALAAFARVHYTVFEIPATKVITLEEMVDELPIVTHPVAGDFHLNGQMANFSSTPGTVRSLAPTIGEHTSEVLAALDDNPWLAGAGKAGVTSV